MRALAYPLAVLLVAAVSAGVVALVVGTRTWVAWVLRGGGLAGAVGLALTAAAAGNLLVPRTCSSVESAAGTLEEVNRPAFSVVVDGGDCFRTGLAQVQLLAIAALGTSAATAVVSARRPATTTTTAI